MSTLRPLIPTSHGGLVLGEIDRVDNNHKLVFALLEQLRKPENFKVLFGKDSTEAANCGNHLMNLFTDHILGRNKPREC